MKLLIISIFSFLVACGCCFIGVDSYAKGNTFGLLFATVSSLMNIYQAEKYMDKWRRRKDPPESDIEDFLK